MSRFRSGSFGLDYLRSLFSIYFKFLVKSYSLCQLNWKDGGREGKYIIVAVLDSL